MPSTLTDKLIERHLVDAQPAAAGEIALRIDQTLTQDATGTLVMLELEALGVERAQTERSVQYVDHNLLQEDAKNADDHLFLHSACRRFGIWFSRAGNGVSHPLHMEHFGRPGATLLGSDSHTCAGGALGMLAIGAGGLEVALAIAGEPFRMPRPRVFGVRLHGTLRPWVSAKDVILEMLRRHGVAGAVGYVLEYHGPGVATLDAWDRHVIANMGAELGATTSVFPADDVIRRFLADHDREDDFRELQPDHGAEYDAADELDLGALEPLIARPSSPGNVVRVAEVSGTPIHQAYIGSSANPGFRDFAIAAHVVAGRQVPEEISLDINPSTRAVLSDLLATGRLSELLDAGARLHQAGCNGCIGMGQAPATGRNSLRTVPRNFPGRSGTSEDSVWLCSPETAAASALSGEITDPRSLRLDAPEIERPKRRTGETARLFAAPPPEDMARRVELIKGPNIRSLPELDPLPNRLELPLALKMGDDISTDEILPAGAKVLPFRSNIDRIADFCFRPIDDGYAQRVRDSGDHLVLGGRNYGQGSSREHAALAPRSLGLRAVLARSFARIHHRNLVSFGVLPLVIGEDDYGALATGDRVVFDDLHSTLRDGSELTARCEGREIRLRHDLSSAQIDILLAGGVIAAKRRSASRRSQPRDQEAASR